MPKNSYGLNVEEMLEDLDRDGVSITIFSPSFHGKYSNKWHIDLKKEDGGVKLEIRTEEHDALSVAVRDVYDKWHSMMDGKLRQHLGVPEIEHQPAAPNTPLDEKIPY